MNINSRRVSSNLSKSKRRLSRQRERTINGLLKTIVTYRISTISFPNKSLRFSTNSNWTSSRKDLFSTWKEKKVYSWQPTQVLVKRWLLNMVLPWLCVISGRSSTLLLSRLYQIKNIVSFQRYSIQ